MKLGVTYPLSEVLDRVLKASDKVVDVLDEMKAEGVYSRDFTVFETSGMLTTSPFARVTLLRSNKEKTSWFGVMETSAFNDGPRVNVSIHKVHYVLVADEDYKNIKIIKVDD